MEPRLHSVVAEAEKNDYVGQTSRPQAIPKRRNEILHELFAKQAWVHVDTCSVGEATLQL